jgi:YHS domain-containing protein
MTVNMDEARAAHRFKPYMVQTYYFCSDTCQQAFEKNPAKYVENAMHGYRLAAPAAMTDAAAHTQVQDPNSPPAKADKGSKTPSDSGAMEPTHEP